MGKPLSKVWEGGEFDVLGKREEVVKSEVQHVSGKPVYPYEGSPPSLSDRLTHVCSVSFFASLEVNSPRNLL
jgi:hypothetical protein